MPPLQGQELVSFVSSLKNANVESAVMRIMEPFASDFKMRVIVKNILDIYNVKHEKLTLEELIELGNNMTFNMSDGDILAIEEATRNQSSCSEWFHQRAGRITASHFKAACVTQIENPSLTTVKTICYPLNMRFTTKATQCGITHEENAAQRYVEEYTATHDSLALSFCGLVISKQHPQLAASPDRLVCCACCGKGCIEIKCPYSLHVDNMTVAEYCKKPSSCLEWNHGQVRLKRNHAFYYQVQLQMYVTNREFCDFVVWSPQEMFVERIKINKDFLKQAIHRALEFHKKVIVPELLARFFTRSLNSKTNVLWCVCKRPDTGEPMLQCDNDECAIQWYHLKCVSLTDVPEGLWLCPSCNHS